MKKLFLVVIIFISLSAPAFAVTALWTGRSEKVQTVTYKWVWRCQYRYLNNYYWYLFEDFCPSSIELE